MYVCMYNSGGPIHLGPLHSIEIAEEEVRKQEERKVRRIKESPEAAR
jgi:tRNA G26 N,N-dimethylase Trm1